MNQEVQEKNGLIDRFIYIFLIVVMWVNGGLAYFKYKNSYANMLLVLGLAVLFIKCVNHDNVKKKISFEKGMLYICACILFLSCLGNRDMKGIMFYGLVGMMLLYGYLLSEYIKIDKLIKIFVEVVFYLAIVSLIFYFLINNFGLKYTRFHSFSPSNMARYYNAYLYAVIDGASERNNSVFWEPGIFGSYLAMACIMELFFIRNKTKKKHIIVFVIAMITTKSTTTILMIFFIFLAWISYQFKDAKAFFLTILMLFIGLYAYFNINEILDWLVKIDKDIFGKLVNENISSRDRLNAPIIDLSIFLENPLLGVGVTNRTDSVNEMMSRLQIVSATNTSTITFFLSTLGAIFSLAYMSILIVPIFKSRRFPMLCKIILSIIFCIVLSVEPYYVILPMYCLFFIIYKSEYPKIEENV